MTQPWRWGAEAIVRRVRSGEVSALEVFESCLTRSRELEPNLGAYLDLAADDGRQRALAVDRKRRGGERLGELAGVPVAIKDNISVAGRPLTCASRILRGFVAVESATVVERLEAADAVIFGKCNLDEFGMGSSCESSAYQRTHNPWLHDRVPGGSSGGSAAAVASGVPVALGSDTGGSIRQPAAFCGVVGIKPTYGLVSRYGLVAFASSTDHIGPLTRSVRDGALTLGAIAGADPRDATCSHRPVADLMAGLEEGIEGIRLGVAEELEIDRLPADVYDAWQRSLAALEDLGAEIHSVSAPTLKAATACYYVLCCCEASTNLARFDGVRYGQRVPAETVDELLRASRSQGFGDEVKRRIMLGTFALSAGHYDDFYGRAESVRQALRRELEQAFERVDALLAPTAPSGAFGFDERTEDPIAMVLSDVYTTPASLTGMPAISVPNGRDAQGLPLGLQIIGPAFEDATVLRIGRAFEHQSAWRIDPLEEAA
ncbi:MAG: Asp-tRNA(Asn)/Glu-tRNA(Gln) amidotransferase subunit GatA [Acidobacteriota bacterium]